MIQRRVRQHLVTNTHRAKFLSKFLEKVYPAFFANAQLVLSGKGIDLQNLLSIDANRLHDSMHPYKRFQVTEGFKSFALHAQLRSNSNTLRLMSQYFGSTAKFHVHSSIKRRILLALIVKKRFEFITQSIALKKAAFHSRKFTFGEIRSFINGGEDPLTKHLVEVKATRDKLYEEYYLNKSRERAETIIRCFARGQVFLPLLTTINAEELANAYIEIAEAATDMASNHSRTETTTNRAARLEAQLAARVRESSAGNNASTRLAACELASGQRPSQSEELDIPFAPLIAPPSTNQAIGGGATRSSAWLRATAEEIGSGRRSVFRPPDETKHASPRYSLVSSSAEAIRRGSTRRGAIGDGVADRAKTVRGAVRIVDEEDNEGALEASQTSRRGKQPKGLLVASKLGWASEAQSVQPVHSSRQSRSARKRAVAGNAIAATSPEEARQPHSPRGLRPSRLHGML
jgi:hypothetical protein